MKLNRIMYDYKNHPVDFFNKFVETQKNIGANKVQAFLSDFATFIKVIERVKHTHDDFDDIANRMERITIGRRPSSATLPPRTPRSVW